MQVEALKIFCDVARLRSFSRGAAENQVTQSTASQTVHHLEEHLGVQLIERAQRPLRLTTEGKTFYEGCREIVHRYFDLEQSMRQLHRAANTQVRIAAIYSVGLGDMNQLAQEFGRRHAPAHAQVEYLHPDRVYERVIEEVADLGIVSFPRSRREVVVIPWRKEEMVLACPPEHPLAKERSVAPRALAGESFVALEENLTIRRETDRFLKRHGVPVTVALEFDNIEAVKRAVEVASGLAILPRPTLQREVQSGTLVAVPLAGAEFTRPLGIIHRRGKRLTASAQHFVELLQTGLNGNGRNGDH